MSYEAWVRLFHWFVLSLIIVAMALVAIMFVDLYLAIQRYG